MIAQFSLNELIFTAVFFFLMALILLLVALRLTGYLGGGTEEDGRDPLEQFVDWMNENGVNHRCYRVDLGDGEGYLVYCIPGDKETDIVFEFYTDSGQLYQYGLDDTIYNELDD